MKDPQLSPCYVLGTPQPLYAFGVCGSCGTKTPITGRPGSKVKGWKCRTCGVNNTPNNEFRFASAN